MRPPCTKPCANRRSGCPTPASPFFLCRRSPVGAFDARLRRQKPYRSANFGGGRLVWPCPNAGALFAFVAGPGRAAAHFGFGGPGRLAGVLADVLADFLPWPITRQPGCYVRCCLALALAWSPSCAAVWLPDYFGRAHVGRLSGAMAAISLMARAAARQHLWPPPGC